MKIEIEVTEEEVKDAIERKIRVAIAEHANGYWIDQAIKEVIKKHWDATVEKIVIEELQNSDKIRAKIHEALENKIKGQLTAILKAGKK